MGKQKSLWTLPLLRSRTRQDRVTLPEMIFGYFLGPFCVLVIASVVSTYYLTYCRTFEDVVGSGPFLSQLPLISVIPMALSNVVMGGADRPKKSRKQNALRTGI